MSASDETRRVRARAAKKSTASVDVAADAESEGFRLISIGSARAPSGCSGQDWLVYRIAQGRTSLPGIGEAS